MEKNTEAGKPNVFVKMFNFVKESFDELKKVTWLNKDEAVNSAIVVIGYIIIISMFLFILDVVFRFVIDSIVKGSIIK